jgi:hypothetical protein
MKKRLLKDLLLWSMVGLSLLLMIYSVAVDRGTRNAEDRAPEIEIGVKLGGFDLKDTKGARAVIPAEGAFLIAFLTSDCGPCQKQVEALNKAARDGHYREVIGVFFEDPVKVRDFETTFSPAFKCLIDIDGALNQTLNLSVYPHIVELQNGGVTRVWVGKQEQLD